MRIGETVEALHAGKRMRRECWHPRKRYLFMVVPARTPGGDHNGAPPDESVERMIVKHPHVLICTRDEPLEPWRPTQMDVLGDDWVEV